MQSAAATSAQCWAWHDEDKKWEAGEFHPAGIACDISNWKPLLLRDETGRPIGGAWAYSDQHTTPSSADINIPLRPDSIALGEMLWLTLMARRNHAVQDNGSRVVVKSRLGYNNKSTVYICTFDMQCITSFEPPWTGRSFRLSFSPPCRVRRVDTVG